jgi:hypothetical protein
VQEQSEQRRRIEEAAREIGERCAACWLRGGEAAAHRTAECAWLREQLGEGYAAVRKQIRYEKGCFCCFLCGLPGDWCEDYAAQRRCRQENVVVPLALAYCGGTAEGRRWLAGAAGGEGADALVRWMGGRAVVGGSRASNAVRAAAEAIRQAEGGVKA